MKRGYKRSYRGCVLIALLLYMGLADNFFRIRNLRLRRSERGKRNSSNSNERRCRVVDAPVPLEHRLIQPTLLLPVQQVQALMIVTRPRRTRLLSWSILLKSHTVQANKLAELLLLKGRACSWVRNQRPQTCSSE